MSNTFKVTPLIYQKYLTCLVDTGADYWVLPRNIFPNSPKSPNFLLSVANGSPNETFGTRLLRTGLQFVLATVNHPILGADFFKKKIGLPHST